MGDQLRKWKDDASAALLKGKHEKALELYLKVVEQDPSDFSCRSQAGYLLRKLGKTKDAVLVFEKMASDYADQGFLLKAIANCKIVLEMDPKHTHIQQKLAELYGKQSGGAGKRSVKVNSQPSTGAQVGGDAVIPAGPDMSMAIELESGAGGTGQLELEQPGSAAVGAGSPPPTFELLDSQDLGLEPIDIQGSLELAGQGGPSAGVGGAVAAASTDLADLLSSGSTSVPTEGGEGHLSSDGLGVDLTGTLTPDPSFAGGIDLSPGPSAPEVLAPSLSPDLSEGLSVDLSPPSPAPTPTMEATPLSTGVSMDGGLLSDAGEPLEATPPLQQPAEVPQAARTLQKPLEAQKQPEGQEPQERDFELNFLEAEVLPTEEVTLPEIPLFSDLDPDAFVAVLESMKLKRLNPGEWVIKEGDTGDSMFAIASGMVEVIKRIGKSKAVKLATLGEGAFFGEMSVLRGGPRRASIRAVSASELFEISRPVLDQVSQRYPSVIEVLRRFAKQRLLRNLLFTSPLFQPFSKEERVAIIERFVSREVESGEPVIEEGSTANGFYLILQGKMDVVRKLESGGALHLGRLEEGDVFGEISCLKKTPAVATVQAASPASVLRLSRNEFDELIMSHPQILEMVNDLGEQRWRLTANALSQKGIFI